MSEHELPHEMMEEEALELSRDKRIALLIAVLAVMLAITEILGQKAQVHALQSNIEASNLWAFYQAKSAREATYVVTADLLSTLEPGLPEASRAGVAKRLEEWKKATERLRENPEKKTGMKELSERAKHAEHERDRAEKKHERYELASAALHIAIVLASAAIITGMAPFVTGALALGGASILLTIFGLVA